MRQFRLHVRKTLVGLIFGGEQRRLHGPGDGKGRIIPEDAPLIRRRIHLGAFIEKTRLITEHAKAMGKPRRNIQLPHVGIGQLEPRTIVQRLVTPAGYPPRHHRRNL